MQELLDQLVAGIGLAVSLPANMNRPLEQSNYKATAPVCTQTADQRAHLSHTPQALISGSDSDNCLEAVGTPREQQNTAGKPSAVSHWVSLFPLVSN